MALDGITSPLSGFGSPFGPTGRPGWLGGGLWGFTASPTPQYAHFGRSTNKAGALASTRNGQALDFDADGNLVTAAANEPLVLPGLGLSNFRDYTNYAANWATPANQNVSLPATGNYTLAIRGTGSVAIAAGTATITGAGSATQAAPVAINCTAIGTVSLTITGTVTYMWLTNTAFRAAPVVTAASPVARLADNTTIPQWQSFVERYSLLDGLTVSGTLNIDRLSAANNRTIFQAGSENEFARLDFTTGNRVRMRLIKGTSPAALFTGSQQGVWYDFSDLSTMFQDAAGTVPVTAPGQPVGRVLDKSGNGNHATQSTAALRPIYQINANGNRGLKFDGVDDFLVTPSIDFSASDKMLVVAGVRKLSEAAVGVVGELGNAGIGANTGLFSIAAPLNTSTQRYGVYSKGTNGEWAATTSAQFTAPNTAILTGQSDIGGDRVRLRVNGSQVAQNTGDQGTGSYGNYPLFIGMRGGASLPFNGFIYQLVVRGGALPGEAELLELEEWIGIRSGIGVGGLTLESGAVSATGLYDISARFKPGDYALTVSGGVSGDTDASAKTLPDAIRTEPAYVGRNIAGSLHWDGNIPSFKIGKAG